MRPNAPNGNPLALVPADAAGEACDGAHRAELEALGVAPTTEPTTEPTT